MRIYDILRRDSGHHDAILFITNRMAFGLPIDDRDDSGSVGFNARSGPRSACRETDKHIYHHYRH